MVCIESLLLINNIKCISSLFLFLTKQNKKSSKVDSMNPCKTQIIIHILPPSVDERRLIFQIIYTHTLWQQQQDQQLFPWSTQQLYVFSCLKIGFESVGYFCKIVLIFSQIISYKQARFIPFFLLNTFKMRVKVVTCKDFHLCISPKSSCSALWWIAGAKHLI